MACREPKNAAERHMMEAWWVRIVAMATNTDEDQVAYLANEEAYYYNATIQLAGALAWRQWRDGTDLEDAG